MDRIRLEMRYQRGDATADDIQVAVNDLLREVANPAIDSSAETLAAGIDRGLIDGVVVEVREAEQGAEPFLTAVLIGITVAASSEVAESIWQDLLWPRVKRRLGARALGARQTHGDRR